MSLGIYVHLPFCPYICPYCDFAKWPMRRSAAARYLDALLREIASRAAGTRARRFSSAAERRMRTMPTRSRRWSRRLRERFSGGRAMREISIEVNPELVRPGDFATYRAAGINRVSIGVQSFEPAEIATLGRKHTLEQVRAAVGACARSRACGRFRSI